MTSPHRERDEEAGRHTPTPWEVRSWRNSVGVCNPNIKDNYASCLAECHCWTNGGNGAKQQPDYVTAKANAELIVRAVNAHDDLIDALLHAETVLDVCARYWPTSTNNNGKGVNTSTGLALKKVRTAIARAEGREAGDD